jgi:UDP-N-acetylglucosamine/UDP-N-acetylgalactosamine diphosphorylase
MLIVYRFLTIRFVHSYCVDNILVKVADPTFVGYCIENNVDFGSKVVAKRDAREAVGVFALKDGKNNVVEYSEIPEELSLAIDPNTNRLAFNAGNIANFLYTVDFLVDCAEIMANHDEYHIAKKKIRAATEKGDIDFRDAIKLELFNFDVVPFAKRVALLEVPREEEFAALKNDISAKNDNAITCRESLSQHHKKLFEQAGGKLAGEGLFEICSTITYDGEGLETYNGQTVQLPHFLAGKKE